MPSGIAAVRGTEFGVLVTDDGTTNIATLTGQVAAIAESVTVPVDAGQVSTLFPGEVPSSPAPLDRVLENQWLSQVGEGIACIWQAVLRGLTSFSVS